MITNSVTVCIARFTILINMLFAPISPQSASAKSKTVGEPVISTHSPVTSLETYGKVTTTGDYPVSYSFSSCSLPGYSSFNSRVSDAPRSNEYNFAYNTRSKTICEYTMSSGTYLANTVIALPFASAPPSVPAASGDLRPFGGPRKAPPTGNDDEEGGNTQIYLPLSDGLWCLLVLAFVYGVISVRRRKQTI